MLFDNIATNFKQGFTCWSDCGLKIKRKDVRFFCALIFVYST